MKLFVWILFGLWGIQGYAQRVTQNPKLDARASPELSLHRVTITATRTIVLCSFLTQKRMSNISRITIFIAHNTRLVDRRTGKAYRLLGAKDIPVLKAGAVPGDPSNQPRVAYPNVRAYYTLYFPKLPSGVDYVDLIEPDQAGFNSPFSFFGVQINNPRALKPVGETSPTLAGGKPKPQVKPKAKPVATPKVADKPTGQVAKKPPATTDSIAVAKKETAPVTSLTGQAFAEGQVIRLNNLAFAQSQYDILPSSFAELNHLVALMQANPRLEILLEGHTDNIGSPVENMKLSQDRVRAVKAYLIQKGTAPERVQTKAYGSTKPLVTNGTPEQRQANRRVELKVLKK
jgi:outer membrane protein OmpA-like peptidoglycan-associated protein